MKKQISLLIMLSSATLMAGCSSITPLQPGAEKIVLTSNTSPSRCHYVGQVSAEDTNGVTQMYTTHQYLQTDEINAMKNQALKLGANVIVLTKHQTTYMNNRPDAILDTHSMMGNAYVCPTNILSTIKQGIISDER